MTNWSLASVQISSGFLKGLTLELPLGLTCIIGPRGSGKSTLAEAIRIALAGLPKDTPKPRADLAKANLADSVVTVATRLEKGERGFTVRRTLGQTAVVTGADNRPTTTVNLDYGTFLPFDAYSSLEIEAIADETLGNKRRHLLDDLCAERMRDIERAISEQRRRLESNAESISAATRRVRECTEKMEEIGDAERALQQLPAGAEKDATPEFQLSSRQRQLNEKEVNKFDEERARFSQLQRGIEQLLTDTKRVPLTGTTETPSENSALLRETEQHLAQSWTNIANATARVVEEVATAALALDRFRDRLVAAHVSQEARYLELQERNQEAGAALNARLKAERDIQALGELRRLRAQGESELRRLREQRKSLKADYIVLCEQVSTLREEVAAVLQAQAGPKVRIRVHRNGDTLEYQSLLASALKGAPVKNRDDIVNELSGIRPDELAPMLSENDFAEFENHTDFGKERGRKIFDALRQSIDLFKLDVLSINDRISIELDVSTNGEPNFRDASALSRGQKCTAILPILLARRDNPLLIDQPEDNLDNHFIYETVVESILRLKSRRQLIFITHNANIPVLGEAERVVVMNSDGTIGLIEKTGSVDDCRDEIVDLLEGGEKAFQMRRDRYGS